MKTKYATTMKAALLLGVTAIAPLLTGCATSRTTGVAPQALYGGPNVYPPVQTYKFTPPPTVHYYGSGLGAIQSGLMNNLGGRR
jgi:hypothetical protein